MADSRTTNAEGQRRHKWQVIYDALLTARTANRVIARLVDGRTVQGALTFNPFKGTGRIIDIDQEVSIDFKIDDIVSLVVDGKRTVVSDAQAIRQWQDARREQLGIVGVLVCMPQDIIPPDHVNWVLESLESVVRACGLEVVEAEPPVVGSFLQWFKCRLRDAASATGTPAALDKARRALAAALLDRPSAEATGALAKPAAELLAAVSRLDTCVIRVGQLVILKEHSGRGRAVTVATISPQLAKKLDGNPTMGMRAPELMEFLRSAALPIVQTTEETGGEVQRVAPSESVDSHAGTNRGDSASA